MFLVSHWKHTNIGENWIHLHTDTSTRMLRSELHVIPVAFLRRSDTSWGRAFCGVHALEMLWRRRFSANSLTSATRSCCRSTVDFWKSWKKVLSVSWSVPVSFKDSQERFTAWTFCENSSHVQPLNLEGLKRVFGIFFFLLIRNVSKGLRKPQVEIDKFKCGLWCLSRD